MSNLEKKLVLYSTNHNFYEVMKVCYGISVSSSNNVTQKIIQMIEINGIFDLNIIHCNDEFGDFYPNIKKKLFIYDQSGLIKTFNEFNGKLTFNENNEKITPNGYFFRLNINTVYIISNLDGGGVNKYLSDIYSHYKLTLFKPIRSIRDLQKYVYTKNDVIFMQHFLSTDLTPNDIINLKKSSEIKLVISIHDFSYINSGILKNIDTFTAPHHCNYLVNNVQINDDIKRMFNLVDVIIHPSIFSFNEYSKYFSPHNFIYVSHNDVKVNPITNCLPAIINQNINIGFLHEFSECKGKSYITKLKDQYQTYHGYNINFFIVGENIPRYSQYEFYDYISKYNIHCLTYLNRWGETYGYCLTYGLNSGLPIIYNNFGSYKERIIQKPQYFKVFENESESTDTSRLYSTFEKLLTYIIENNGKMKTQTCSYNIEYNPFYDQLFNENRIVTYDKIHRNIQPYAMYLPQFHEITENNINFYQGYNDIINLKLLKSETNLANCETPANYLYNSPEHAQESDIALYNLEKNQDIINKQVNLASIYGLSGFAIYYYWFSINTITQNHMIMKAVIDRFFQYDYPKFRVFFSWANENWTGNPAFGKSDNIISNIYDSDNFQKNIENLMTYFKHNNYLKINNKPVFAIHQPWFMKSELIEICDKLQIESVKNGFSGVHVICNSMEQRYENDNIVNYQFHPNYKNWTGQRDNNTISYDIYCGDKTKEIVKTDIQTIFFDFNNSARLFKPNRLQLVTKMIDNTESNITEFLKCVLSPYKDRGREDNKKIFLINAWNEWGEKMTIEPSNERGTYYLDLLFKNLMKLISDS
jgi:hypothetical protein